MAPGQLVPSDQRRGIGPIYGEKRVVPARRGEQTNIRSRLAAARVAQGITQAELARVVGISRTSLVRLERNAVRDPPLGWYVNCAIALGLRLDDVLEDDAYEWHAYDRSRPPPVDWAK